jgi:hypothetical protein
MCLDEKYELSKVLCSARKQNLKQLFSEKKGFVSNTDFGCINAVEGRSQWPRVLRHRSAAASLLRLWVQFPSGAWMFVCWECCVLSGRCLCNELITPPYEYYRLWCVVVCNLEISRMRRSWPALGENAPSPKKTHTVEAMEAWRKAWYPYKNVRLVEPWTHLFGYAAA